MLARMYQYLMVWSLLVIIPKIKAKEDCQLERIQPDGDDLPIHFRRVAEGLKAGEISTFGGIIRSTQISHHDRIAIVDTLTATPDK